MTHTEALTPCPFCGKAHTLTVTPASAIWDEEDFGPYMHSETYAVICDASKPDGPGGCGATGGYFDTEAEAVEAWNRRAAQQPAPAGWRPIETAPKDGSLFMCWVSAVRYGETDEGQQYQQDASQVDFCSWRDGPPDLPGHGYFDPCCGQIGDSQDVTHWMPLPAAPTVKESLTIAAAPTAPGA